ncbi:SDR family NAD(P)-dependent oxidoreductase [Microbacterium sp. ZW T5_56]|uniref:SDR family NAD(P)-dependent oxidoreductase n=1 Tax=Microbacterium sp. ZW T5_56 TaxID=3378081 RepID=UPI003853AF1E
MTAAEHTPRVVIVTGGGTGIGAAITRAFAGAGDAVVVCQRSEADAAAARAALSDAGPGRIVVVAQDLADPLAAAALVSAAIAEFDTVDVLVNNAAITGPGSGEGLLELTDHGIDETIAVNLTSAFRLVREAGRVMAASGRGGVILNIGSVAASAAQLNASVYGATKAGLHALTQSIAIELSPHGIRAVTIAPGDIATKPLPEQSTSEGGGPTTPWIRATPLGRRGTPEDVAATALFLASEDAGFLTGTVVGVDGGWLAY